MFRSGFCSDTQLPCIKCSNNASIIRATAYCCGKSFFELVCMLKHNSVTYKSMYIISELLLCICLPKSFIRYNTAEFLSITEIVAELCTTQNKMNTFIYLLNTPKMAQQQNITKSPIITYIKILLQHFVSFCRSLFYFTKQHDKLIAQSSCTIHMRVSVTTNETAKQVSQQLLQATGVSTTTQ